MRDWQPNGKHRMCAEGDAMYWEINGDIDIDEMRRSLEFGEEIIARHGCAFLIMNGARARSATPAARRFQADWALTHDITHRGRSVVYGTNKFVRALAMLVVRASQLFARQSPTVDFVDTEEDAQEWLARQRAAWAKRQAVPQAKASPRDSGDELTRQ